MSGFTGHIDSWLATARQEKIISLKGVNGHNQKLFNEGDLHNDFRLGLVCINNRLCVSDKARQQQNRDLWLTIAHQEKIISLKGINIIPIV